MGRAGPAANQANSGLSECQAERAYQSDTQSNPQAARQQQQQQQQQHAGAECARPAGQLAGEHPPTGGEQGFGPEPAWKRARGSLAGL